MISKRNFIASMFLLFCTNIFADVQFIVNDWEQARSIAQQTNKYIFMDCYTDWCSWCKVMDRETFSDKTVADFMSANFVASKMDMEKGTGMTLAMKYGVSGFPTFLVFNSSGQLLYRSVGYQKPEPFLATLKTALEIKEPIKGYSQKLDLNYPQFLKDVSDGDPSTKFPKEEEVIAYLDKQNDLHSEVNWSIMKRFRPAGKYKSLFLNNIEKYKELYGETEVNDYLDALIDAEAKRAVKDKSEAEFQDLMAMIDKYKGAEAADYKMEYQIRYYMGTENWNAFADAVQKMMDKKQVNADMINTYSWTVYEKCDDPEIVKSAASWMSKTVTREPLYAYLDTYAALLYKMKDYATAQKYAEIAISKGKETGEKTTSTEELLTKIKTAMAK